MMNEIPELSLQKITYNIATQTARNTSQSLLDLKFEETLRPLNI